MVVVRFLNRVLKLGTGEFLLDHFPNSNGIILVRACMNSIILFVLALVLKNAEHLTSNMSLWFGALIHHSSENVPWLGALAGATYAGLYAKFGSQWSYLANLYNQIKQIESTTVPTSAGDPQLITPLDELKLAFIEDAETLHLSRKRCFASVIVEWWEEVRGKHRRNDAPIDAHPYEAIVANARNAASIRPPPPAPTPVGPP